jgi:hypothetical protein
MSNVQQYRGVIEMSTQETTEELGMAAQAALNKKNKAARASGETVEEPATELPKGAAQVEASESEGATEESTAAVLEGAEVEAAPAKVEEEEEPIRIAGKTFKTQKEAIEYAEKLEQEKLIAEAHAMGVREAIAAQQAATPPPVVEEEDFDTKFYSNPKETLREIQARARDEAVAVIRAETARERAWNEFLAEYPDIRRQDAEVILSNSAKTIGVLPWEEGRKALAQAVYKEYDEIANLRRPKTELHQKKQVLSPSGGAARGVTPKGEDEKPLSFSQQLRRLKR